LSSFHPSSLLLPNGVRDFCWRCFDPIMADAPGTLAFKVVLLGEGRVGKTSLVLQYVHNTFSPSQESTIQATYLDKRLNIGKQSVKLMIWDTAGQERFHALGPIYYREANAALLVYDVTDRDSFTKVRKWVQELKRIVGEDIVLCIAGNKSDLEKQRQVDDAEAKDYAEKVGAFHALTSAKTGKGVEDVFLQITQMVLKKNQSGGRSEGPTGRNFVQIVEKAEDENSKKSCC